MSEEIVPIIGEDAHEADIGRNKLELLKAYPFRFVMEQSAWIAAVSIVITDEEMRAAPSAHHLQALIKSKVLDAFSK